MGRPQARIALGENETDRALDTLRVSQWMSNALLSASDMIDALDIEAMSDS